MPSSPYGSSPQLHTSPATRQSTASPFSTPIRHGFHPKRRRIVVNDNAHSGSYDLGVDVTEGETSWVGPSQNEGECADTADLSVGSTENDTHEDTVHIYDQETGLVEVAEYSSGSIPLCPLQSLSCDTVISGAAGEVVVCASWCGHADLIAIVTKTVTKPSTRDEVACSDVNVEQRASTACVTLTADGCAVFASEGDTSLDTAPPTFTDNIELSAVPSAAVEADAVSVASAVESSGATAGTWDGEGEGEMTDEQYAALAARWGDYVDPFASDTEEEAVAAPALAAAGSLTSRTGAGVKVSDKEDTYHLTVRTGAGRALFRVEVPAIGGDGDDGAGSGWFGCNPLAMQPLNGVQSTLSAPAEYTATSAPAAGADAPTEELWWPRAADTCGGVDMSELLRGALTNTSGNADAVETTEEECAAMMAAVQWLQRGGAVHVQDGFLAAGYGCADRLAGAGGASTGALVRVAEVPSVKAALAATDKGAAHIHELVPELAARLTGAADASVVTGTGAGAMLLVPRVHHPAALVQLPLVTAAAWHPHAPYVALGLRTGATLVFAVATPVPVPLRGVSGLAAWSQACEGPVMSLFWSNVQPAVSGVAAGTSTDVFAHCPLPPPLPALNTASEAAQKARMMQTAFRTNFPEHLLGNPYHQALSAARAADGSLRGFTVLCAAGVSTLQLERCQEHTPTCTTAPGEVPAPTADPVPTAATAAAPTFDPSGEMCEGEMTDEQYAALAAQWGNYVDPFASDDEEEETSPVARHTAAPVNDASALASAPLASSAVVVRLLAHGWASMGALHIPQAMLHAPPLTLTQQSGAPTRALCDQAVPLSVSLYLSEGADKLTVLLGPPATHNTSVLPSSAQSLALSRALYSELHYRLPSDYLRLQARFAYCISGLEQALYLLYQHTRAAHARWLVVHAAITRKWGFVRDDLLDYYNNTKAVTMADVMLVGSDRAAQDGEDEDAEAAEAAASASAVEGLNVSYVPAEMPTALEDSAYDAFGLFGNDSTLVNQSMAQDDAKTTVQSLTSRTSSAAHSIAAEQGGGGAASVDMDIRGSRCSGGEHVHGAAALPESCPYPAARTCLCGSSVCLEASTAADPDKYWVLRRELLAAISSGPTHPVLATFFQQYNEVKAMERLMDGVEGALTEMLESVGERAIPVLDHIAWWVGEAVSAAAAASTRSATQSSHALSGMLSPVRASPELLAALQKLLDTYWAFIRSVFFARYSTQQFLAFWKGHALLAQAPDQTDPSAYDAAGSRLLSLFDARAASAWVCNYMDSEGGVMSAWFKKLAVSTARSGATSTPSMACAARSMDAMEEYRAPETLTPAAGCMHACPLALGAAYVLLRERARAAAMDNDAYAYHGLWWEWANADSSGAAEGRVVGTDRLRAAGLAALDEGHHIAALVTSACARASGEERYGALPAAPCDPRALPPVLKQVLQPQCVYEALETLATAARTAVYARDAACSLALVEHSVEMGVDDAIVIATKHCSAAAAKASVCGDITTGDIKAEARATLAVSAEARRLRRCRRVRSRMGKYALPTAAWRLDAAVPQDSVHILAGSHSLPLPPCSAAEAAVDSGAVAAEVVPLVRASRVSLITPVDISRIITYACGFDGDGTPDVMERDTGTSAYGDVDKSAFRCAQAPPQNTMGGFGDVDGDGASVVEARVAEADGRAAGEAWVDAAVEAEDADGEETAAADEEAAAAAVVARDVVSDSDGDGDEEDAEGGGRCTNSFLSLPAHGRACSFSAIAAPVHSATSATACAVTASTVALTLTAPVAASFPGREDSGAQWLCTLLLDFAPTVSAYAGGAEDGNAAVTDAPRMVTVLGLSLAPSGALMVLLRHCCCLRTCAGLCPTPTHTETRVVDVAPYLAAGYEAYWRVALLPGCAEATAVFLTRAVVTVSEDDEGDVDCDEGVDSDGLVLAVAATMPTVYPRTCLPTANTADARMLTMSSIPPSLCSTPTHHQLVTPVSSTEGLDLSAASSAPVLDSLCTGASLPNVTRTVAVAALTAGDTHALSRIQMQMSNGLVPLLVAACPARGRALVYSGHHYLYTQGQKLLGKSLANSHMFDYLWTRVCGNRTDLRPRSGTCETKVMAYVGVEGNGVDMVVKDHVSGGYSSVVIDLDA